MAMKTRISFVPELVDCSMPGKFRKVIPFFSPCVAYQRSHRLLPTIVCDLQSIEAGKEFPNLRGIGTFEIDVVSCFKRRVAKEAPLICLKSPRSEPIPGWTPIQNHQPLVDLPRAETLSFFSFYSPYRVVRGWRQGDGGEVYEDFKQFRRSSWRESPVCSIPEASQGRIRGDA